MALTFASKGAHLFLWDLRQELLVQVEKEIQIKYPSVDVRCYVCDVSKRAMVSQVANEVKGVIATTQGPSATLDVLVNNAGVVIGKRLLDLTEEEVRRTMDVNILAHFWTVQEFLPAMLSRNHGHIITIASTMGLVGSAGLTDYCSSKFAAVGFGEALRMEIMRAGKSGVWTTVICPNAISTGMFDGISPRLQWLVPFLKEQEVADAVVSAAETGRTVRILPFAINLIYPITRLFPIALRDVLLSFVGATHAMDTFKGRGVDWSMKTTNTAGLVVSSGKS
eukprot:TRINITY_DN632_c0_g2_i3.p1 TRINITY_DN632_c0_g2~~TRINITY_DN632_c0_g2_i3.p1  ORF type:complete len:280 (-),score=68.64 TRINITY_DN632_c0_g2_i3:86-925(-)